MPRSLASEPSEPSRSTRRDDRLERYLRVARDAEQVFHRVRRVDAGPVALADHRGHAAEEKTEEARDEKRERDAREHRVGGRGRAVELRERERRDPEIARLGALDHRVGDRLDALLGALGIGIPDAETHQRRAVDRFHGDLRRSGSR